MSKIQGQQVSYKVDGRNLLEDVSFTLNTGEIVSLIGPNGAGKSTLLKCILGIIKPTNGKITIDGQDIQSLKKTSLSEYMSYLSQDKKLAWPGKVKNIVALGRFSTDANFTKPTPASQSALNKAMKLCQIDKIANRSVASLSGGELARVQFARAVASDTPYLLADEPFASLDMKHQKELVKIMRTYAQQGTCNLVVMHELSLAANFSDRLIWLKTGKVVAEGTVKETLTTERILEVFEVRSKINWNNDICHLSFN
jgi:iron complex transport system ATP-binding protein